MQKMDDASSASFDFVRFVTVDEAACNECDDYDRTRAIAMCMCIALFTFLTKFLSFGYELNTYCVSFR